MMDTERDEVIKSVILVLLGEDLAEKQSLQENLQEGVSRETARVAIGRDMTPASFAAVETIVSKMNLPRDAVDFVVGKCLEIHEKEKGAFVSIRLIDALNVATRLIFHGASKETIEKVIGVAAENGWYGRIESLARELLGRGLTPMEVQALVNHYINNKGCRCEDAEAELLRMARKYLSPKEAAIVESRIWRFISEFENSWD